MDFNGMIFILICFLLMIQWCNIRHLASCKKNNDSNKIKIDVKNHFLVVNNKQYSFNQIAHIEVLDGDSPGFMQRWFTKTGRYYYADGTCGSIVFHLKDGECVKYSVASKPCIYNILRKLEPYMVINECIENYKQPFFDAPSILALIYIIFAFRDFNTSAFYAILIVLIIISGYHYSANNRL